MLEWLLLPALILIVILSIVTAKPKPDDGRDEGGEDQDSPES